MELERSSNSYTHTGQSTRHTETSQKDNDDSHTLMTWSTGHGITNNDRHVCQWLWYTHFRKTNTTRTRHNGLTGLNTTVMAGLVPNAHQCMGHPEREKKKSNRDLSEFISFQSSFEHTPTGGSVQVLNSLTQLQDAVSSSWTHSSQQSKKFS